MIPATGCRRFRGLWLMRYPHQPFVFKDFKVLKVPNDLKDLKAGFARATLMAFFQKTSCNILIDCTWRMESRWTV